jgi:hypothetical protein
MLKSSQVPSSLRQPHLTAPRRNTLRKAKSTDSLHSPRHPSPTNTNDFASPTKSPSRGSSPAPPHWTNHAASKSNLILAGTAHVRGASFDVFKSTDKPSTRPTHAKQRSFSKNTITPTKMCSMLNAQSSTELDVEVSKRLRLLLRNELAGCVSLILRRARY